MTVTILGLPDAVSIVTAPGQSAPVLLPGDSGCGVALHLAVQGDKLTSLHMVVLWVRE